MTCPGCGASYGSTFKFCPHCGRAKPDPKTMNVQVEGDRYETWPVREELISEPLFGKPKYKLVAYAAGPKGRYIAAETPVFARNRRASDLFGDYDRKGTPAYETVDGLIQQLCENGWESLVGYVSNPHHLKFRRRVKSE